MKSIVQESATVAKAVEKALNVAGNPREFTVKILEYPEKNFFGITTKYAKISLLFENKESQARTEKQPHKYKPSNEKPKAEKKQKKSEKLVKEVEKETKVSKPKHKAEDQSFWTEPMVDMVKNWLKSTISNMEKSPIDVDTDINRYYLRITFSQPLHSDEEKERQIFRSFSYLILQSLRTKLQRPLRGFKIVLTRG